MKHAAAIMIGAVLMASAPGSADAWKKDWNRFWKQATDKQCWKDLGKKTDYERQNCYM